MNTRRIFLVAALGLLALAVIMPGLFGSAAEAVRQDLIDAPRSGGLRPPEKDVRGGVHGVPKSSVARSLSSAQAQGLRALQAEVGGAPLVVQYNALTNTPRHLFSRAGYLTPPTAGDAESISRSFLKRWQGIFRFTDADLDSLKIKSRSHIPDMGTDVLVFEQQVGGVPVYKGEVLVNVNREGRVLSIGSDSFPQMKVTNAVAIAPAAAIEYAARDMGLAGYNGQSLGATRVLASYGIPSGKSKARYIEGQKFSGGNLFTDEIVVTRTVFPLGGEARHAYKFNLTTPQYSGITWENIVDAETGEVLHRFSLTMFQGATKKAKGKANTRPLLPAFGPPGGGPIDSRRGSYRPDLQDLVESFNGTASALVVDAAPTTLGGRRCTQTALPASPTFDPNCGGATAAESKAYGRPAARGQRPGYRPDVTDPATVPRNNGRGFQEGMVRARVENPFSINGGALFDLVYNTPFGQLQRGMPDALNPSPGSLFGWYYLPTGTGGAEITRDDTNSSTTRDYGYTMTPEAKRRNVPENAPGACTGADATRECDQPFSATLTPLASPVVLPDGRTLESVFQSNYTEGNNAHVSDDRANDNQTTIGIRGYDPNRQFTASRFIFTNGYEFGGVNATNQPAPGVNCPPFVVCPVNFPASSNPDVYPGTLTLFYYNNIMHDYMYEIGFTEALFNMQQDNFGRGGSGRDAVIAQVQDGSGLNNANMLPQPEGSKPRMQMFLFTENSFRRADGSFDFDVVAHEQMHAINNRAVGKGDNSCVGNGLAGESGGQGEGWGDYIADSMGDDDAIGEYVTGEFDVAIRRLPITNYRWSYQSINGNGLTRRDRSYNPAALPDPDPGAIPFETHDTGEVWSATLWDMRELMIMKDPNGVFFDGTRRLGTGTSFFIGNRQVQSVDNLHPIEYRPGFMTTLPNADPTLPPVPNIRPAEHIVRPGLIAAEIQTTGNRNGPKATAVRNGAFLADTLMMRGMQLSPCNPTFVDSRDSILLADRERFGGENHAIIWRAFASHGIGLLAASSSNGGAGGTVVEDFSVPAGVTMCEQNGPLPAPDFSLANTAPNAVTVTIQPVAGAVRFII
ncbi:MAG TPA: M36 family metallopeptidase, partial [Pyrinomonadaceae bacterium]|nr:M36 family metallopeptidase [Pyrinomonadaceae bacterium]